MQSLFKKGEGSLCLFLPFMKQGRTDKHLIEAKVGLNNLTVLSSKISILILGGFMAQLSHPFDRLLTTFKEILLPIDWLLAGSFVHLLPDFALGCGVR